MQRARSGRERGRAGVGGAWAAAGRAAACGLRARWRAAESGAKLEVEMRPDGFFPGKDEFLRATPPPSDISWAACVGGIECDLVIQGVITLVAGLISRPESYEMTHGRSFLD